MSQKSESELENSDGAVCYQQRAELINQNAAKFFRCLADTLITFRFASCPQLFTGFVFLDAFLNNRKL